MNRTIKQSPKSYRITRTGDQVTITHYSERKFRGVVLSESVMSLRDAVGLHEDLGHVLRD